MLDAARRYHEAGLCVVPAKRREKRPALPRWKEYQNRLPTPKELAQWIPSADALCLVTGKVSGNLEMIDFDLGGDRYQAWVSLVEQRAPGLMERLVVETSQSGGRHVVYRCATPVNGSMKLAQRAVKSPDDQQVTIHGKVYKPRRLGDEWIVVVTLIETRGEGAVFLCDPTPGYSLEQGDFASLPVLTEDERIILIDAALGLNEWTDPVELTPGSASNGSARPGDEFNRRGDPREVLRRHGWTLARPGENEYWRRPGKTEGWSATLKGGVFYCFTSNAPPFEANRAYAPFAVNAMLEHGGDFSAAARDLRAIGYGDNVAGCGAGFESRITVGQACGDENVEPHPVDPGPVPVELLRIPGFVGEVMDHCLETAPYPNQVLAFCGALALQAFLAGRKVRDPGDNRTNIYLLGLAHSAAGKDWPRKVNTRLLHAVGLANSLGERFASGEGIQDALFLTPSMLFQTDEIDGMLQSINKAKDARHEAIMSTLLTMYSVSNSIFPMRRKAGMEHPGVIVQPNLVIFGTAIPNHYYEALSERMLTNGFFARMIILEAGPRGAGQEPRIGELPPRVVETAKWWADGQPEATLLGACHPVPALVEHTSDAMARLVENRLEAEAEYAKAERGNDSVGTTVWGRVSEQVRKLALIYAVSECYDSPRIQEAAVEWASRFVMHHARRMLFMAASHAADNPFHGECLKVLKKLRSAPGRELPHSVLLKRMKMDAKSFSVLMETLIQQGLVAAETTARSGSAFRSYRLAGVVKPGGER